ncbi:MAG: hypothetical protein LAT63_03405 [Marinobacter sp.]|nr:hypothetical protein [Marinobacter sp.]
MAAITAGDTIRAFFDDFVTAFSQFDGALIATRYSAPYQALLATGELQSFSSEQAIAAHFQTVLDGYREAGCVACRYHALDALPVGPACVLATVTWSLLDGEGEVVQFWRESYNLARTPEGWRIFASIDH